METTLAILMVLGIFVGIPAVIGFAIAGFFVLADRRARRAERALSTREVVTAAEKVVAEAAAHRRTKKAAKVA